MEENNLGLDAVIDLVRIFAETDDDDQLVDAYYELFDFGQPVIDRLIEIVADESYEYRAKAALLIEGFSSSLDARPALGELWKATSANDNWLRLFAAGAIWTIDNRTETVFSIYEELQRCPDEHVRTLAKQNMSAMREYNENHP
jgi:hypothetical protein